MTESTKKNWNIGDILGRSKDYQPVNTDERDGLVGDDSDSEVIFYLLPCQNQPCSHI